MGGKRVGLVRVVGGCWGQDEEPGRQDTGQSHVGLRGRSQWNWILTAEKLQIMLMDIK